MTTQDQLNQINNAISAIENGAQEYRIGSRTIKRGDLATLYAERQRLEQKFTLENNSGIFVATFDRR
jgi:hypothetical protein